MVVFGGPDTQKEIIAERRATGLDRHDEVWDGVYVIIDRQSWKLILYRLQDGELATVGESTLEHPRALASEVLPLSFRLIPGEARPQIEIVHSDGEQRWVV